MDRTDPEVVDGNNYVKDYLIENCVIWSTLANVYRVGVSYSENIAMQDCDFIHFGRFRDPNVPWSIIHSGSKNMAKNYRFENIRFEEYVPFLGIIGSEEVHYSNIVSKDITMKGTEKPWVVGGYVDGLIFDNVKINGKFLTGREDLPIEDGGKEIKNLVFK
jgi:hypothetical protein